MSKSKQKGNTMSEEIKPVVAVENDFGPVVVGGKQGDGEAREVELPKDPSPVAAVAEPENEVIDEAAAAQAVVADREFTEYVNGELAAVARSLGYEITLKKVEGENDEFRGPTMRYDPESEEGRVFRSKADVPAGWLSGEQLNEKRAAARAE